MDCSARREAARGRFPLFLPAMTRTPTRLLLLAALCGSLLPLAAQERTAGATYALNPNLLAKNNNHHGDVPNHKKR